MKISIDAESLSMRVSRDELELFAQEGMVKERVVVDEEPLVYVSQRTSEEKLRATLHTNLITLLVPDAIADEWINTDQPSFEDSNAGLKIIIEKDF